MNHGALYTLCVTSKAYLGSWVLLSFDLDTEYLLVVLPLFLSLLALTVQGTLLFHCY